MSISIDTAVPPSGDGCKECLEGGGWWFHLRRCAQCGHVGCCDSSPSGHATLHFQETGHNLMQSFEPDEDWGWDYLREEEVDLPALASPSSHPASQPTPGPEGRVPDDWRSSLN